MPSNTIFILIIIFFVTYSTGFEYKPIDLADIEYGHDISRQTAKYEQEEMNANMDGEVEYGTGYESGNIPSYKLSQSTSTGSHGFQYGSQFKSPIMDDYDQWDDWGLINDPQGVGVDVNDNAKMVTEKLSSLFLYL